MASSAAGDPSADEPVTPAGRLFLQPEMNQIINCAIGFQNPINIDLIKSTLQNSPLLSNPRFSSLLVRDSDGREHWRKTTHVDIDRHVIVLHEPLTTSPVDHETAINDYLAELCTGTGLPADKPLWEFHLLMAHKCGVVRIHHALGDGVSLMALLVAGCRRAGDEVKIPTFPGKRNRASKEKGWWAMVNGFWGMMWFSLIFVVEFVMRSLWVCDGKTEISGGDGVELWPRKLATARFRLQDMKLIKNSVPDATINDVLIGVISSGLSRYLYHRDPNGLRDGTRMTGIGMVNLRREAGLQELSDLMKEKSGSGWGNKFGMMLLPVYYHKSGGDPLAYLRRAKAMLDRKKQSLEAHFSYAIGLFVMTYFGAKVASWLNYRIVCHTTFTISNVLGPQEEITLGGNPITYLRVNNSSLPHALTMHMMSYAGGADMQIVAAKDIIPDPVFLAKCFEEALIDMKEAVAAIHRT